MYGHACCMPCSCCHYAVCMYFAVSRMRHVRNSCQIVACSALTQYMIRSGWRTFLGRFCFLVCPLVADGPHVTARGRTAWDWARDVRVVLNHIHNMGRRVLAFGHGGKEKSCFLSPTYGGLLSVGSQIRMYKFECFRNAESSFSDYNMLWYVGYIISCYIILYSVMFYHDFLKRIHCEITCLSRLQSTT